MLQEKTAFGIGENSFFILYKTAFMIGQNSSCHRRNQLLSWKKLEDTS